MCMFGTVYILHILQKRLLVLGNIESLNLRIDIHAHVQLPKRPQLPEGIKDVCRNEEHNSRWSDFSIIFK